MALIKAKMGNFSGQNVKWLLCGKIQLSHAEIIFDSQTCFLKTDRSIITARDI